MSEVIYVGWKCPECGLVLSPRIDRCAHMKKPEDGFMSSKALHYHKIVDQLIFFNRFNRSLTDSSKRSEELGLHEYLKQFCTIRLFAGRDSGSTSYIYMRESLSNSAVISLTKSIRGFRRDLGLHMDPSEINYHMEYESGSVPVDKTFTLIFVDDPTDVFKRVKGGADTIYRLFGKSAGQTFALLGE